MAAAVDDSQRASYENAILHGKVLIADTSEMTDGPRAYLSDDEYLDAILFPLANVTREPSIEVTIRKDADDYVQALLSSAKFRQFLKDKEIDSFFLSEQNMITALSAREFLFASGGDLKTSDELFLKVLSKYVVIGKRSAKHSIPRALSTFSKEDQVYLERLAQVVLQKCEAVLKESNVIEEDNASQNATFCMKNLTSKMVVSSEITPTISSYLARESQLIEHEPNEKQYGEFVKLYKTYTSSGN